MNDIAIVPLKKLTEAKKRLTNYLDLEKRKSLVLAMLDDVLDALDNSKLFARIYVVSPDKSVEERVLRHKAHFMRQKGKGLNSALRQGLRQLKDSNAASVTVALADLPLATASDFKRIAKISNEKPRIVLSPSMKGGTNVMLRSPPGVINTYYGRWSYAKHLRAGQGKNVPVYSISNPRLSFDVDTIQDVKALSMLESARKTHAWKAVRRF